MIDDEFPPIHGRIKDAGQVIEGPTPERWKGVRHLCVSGVGLLTKGDDGLWRDSDGKVYDYWFNTNGWTVVDR
jgi:hypothetical protein